MVAEAADVRGFSEQESAGLAESTAVRGTDMRARLGAGRLVSEGAPSQWTDVVIANTIIPVQGHSLLVSPASGGP